MEKFNEKIALIEGNRALGKFIQWELSKQSRFELRWFKNAQAFLTQTAFQADLIVLSHEPKAKEQQVVDNFQLLDRVGGTPVIVMSTQKEIESAMNLIRKGAYDYFEKDEFVISKILKSAEEILEYQRECQQMSTIVETKRKEVKRIRWLLVACSILAIGAHLLG